MIRRAGLALLAVAAATGAGILLAPAEAPAPRDRPIEAGSGLPDAARERPLRLTVLGTSLTRNADWPERLALALDACLPRGARLTRIAQAGATSAWGVEQLDAVAGSEPDVVLVEFSINDADLLDGVSLAQSRADHRRLIEGLRAREPAPAIVLLTMSPAQGPRGWLRPRLARYYALYPELGASDRVGVADLYARWLSRPRRDRGLAADGLHPDPGTAAAVIVPVLVPLLAQGAGATCAPPEG